VGILPSNRTLVFGVLHLDRVPSPMPVVISEHCPTADDPFTGTVSAVGKKKLDGKTAVIKFLDVHAVEYYKYV
jgi:hypothetical protein